MRTSKDSGKPSGTRSTEGCWTCRLRRKKCDETRPVCHTCTTLGISCHGYGPRPSWMDRGPLEREKAQSIKLEIARNGIKRKRPRAFTTVPLARMEVESEKIMDDCIKSHSFGQLDGTMCLSRYLPKGLQTTLNAAFVDASPTMGLLREMSPSLHHQLATDAIVRQNGLAGGDGSPSDILSPNESELDPYPHSVDPLLSLNQDWESSDTGFDYEACLHLGSLLPLETPVSLSEILQGVGASGSAPSNTPSCYSSRSSGTINSNSTNVSGEVPLRDAISLSRYLDRTLLAQFPFVCDPVASCRQWMEFLLFSSKHVFKITLILSRAQNFPEGSLEQVHAKNLEDDVSRAVAVLKSLPSSASSLSLLDEELKRSHVVAACACLVQTIFLEVHHSGSSHWQSCLEQAAPYMHALIDLASSTSTDGQSRDATTDPIYQVQTAAARALLGQLIWFDIAGTISTGAGPLLGINHSYLLDSNTVDMKNTTGCENWVVKALYQIHGLRHWRTREEGSRRLSIIELAERGGTILEFLNSNLIQLNNHLGPNLQISNSQEMENASWTGPEPSGRDGDMITMTFVRAAIVYLHVVISGPNPLLEDVRREIPHLVASFKELASRKLLGFASWPLCVAACFGEEHEFHLLQSLGSSERDSRRRGFETCDRALKIAEECRKARDNGASCDWAETVQRLHWRFLLL